MTYPSAEWMVIPTISESFPAYQDDHDSSNTGICGEKTITLDPSTPTFLTLVPNPSDPVFGAFTIQFDDSTATEDDIMVHTVAF